MSNPIASPQKKLFKNTILFSIGSFGSKLLTYILVPFYTSILTTKQYGICDTIITTVSLLYPILSFSISEAVFRFSIDKKALSMKYLKIGLIFSLFGIAIVLLGLPLLGFFNELSPYKLLFLFYFASITIYTLFSQYSKGIDKTKEYAVSGLLVTLVTLTLLILLLRFLNAGIYGFLAAYVAGNCIGILYLFFACRIHRNFFKTTSLDRDTVKMMLLYSIPIIPNAASWWISTSSDKYFLNYFCDYSTTGIYSIAYKIPSLMTLLTGLFLSAWQITSAEEYGKHDEMFGSIYSKFLTILICIVGLIIPFTKIISSLMFSNDFYMAWEYVPVLLFAYIFHDLSAYLGSISTASKKTKTLFVSTLIGAILNIVLNLLLIPYLGAFGAAIATLLSYALVWIFRVFDSKKRVAIHYSFLIHAGDFAILTLQIICVFIGGVFFFILSFVLYLLLIVINAKSLRSLFVGARNVLKKRNMY